MALQKREKKREGVTFLIYGESATGKTPTGLSFPNQILFDSDGGTKFYGEYDDNILSESNTLVFKEMNEDLDDLENDEELFEQVETLNVDSITRYFENMQHAALKIAEQRAMKAGRAVEGEGISVKERGVMKLHYDRFFARLLTYVKQGKNLVFVAEQADLNENRTDAQGNQISVKVGIKPNMQKDSKFDFDVVVNTYNGKDGKSYGKIEKDRTKTFKVGDVVELPNYTHWKDAIEVARQGRVRTKEEIKDFDQTLNSEVGSLGSGGDKSVELIGRIDNIIATLAKEKQKELADAFKAKLGSVKYKDLKDVKKLEEYLAVAEAI